MYTSTIRTRFQRIVRRTLGERGASLVEYAFLVALIAIACILAITFFGEQNSSTFVETGNSIRTN